ncbi:hypothetical protein B0H16DRAFT_1904568 [Mycena metata]|uniref:BZIP domain-containing protein n=1 Tax=Mycena metata TaxID=1033252 RepID=A0AAD7DKG6_9AGAR|nr:hypothetical protein B0H16DRAFT_1904568 [Mycena metata]
MHTSRPIPPPRRRRRPKSSAAPVIALVKLGGHGKACKGTLGDPPPRTANNKGGDDDEDGDDLPTDCRPPPEVFQKISSKEKRQLRNRVRRKEYISTLEDNIERDRLLSAIRSELGPRSLRTLRSGKKSRPSKGTGPGAGVAAVRRPTSNSTSTSSAAGPSTSSTLAKELAAAHTLKDVSSSSATARFCQGTGGLGMGGSTPAQAQAQAQQQENLNPLLNLAPSSKVTEVVRAGLGLGAGTGAPGATDPTVIVTVANLGNKVLCTSSDSEREDEGSGDNYDANGED